MDAVVHLVSRRANGNAACNRLGERQVRQLNRVTCTHCLRSALAHPELIIEEPRRRVTNGPADLYRYFDANGQLLYVGISLSALRRAVQHRNSASWWQAAVRMDIDHLPTRAAALDAELAAIRNEHPLHNVAGVA